MSRKREATKHPALYPVVLPKVGEFVPATVWKEQALDDMHAMVPEAVKQLKSLVKIGAPDQVKLQAIRLLMQVVGLGEVNQEQAKTPLTVNVGMFNTDGKTKVTVSEPDRPG